VRQELYKDARRCVPQDIVRHAREEGEHLLFQFMRINPFLTM
jgi:hypothetical protein